MLPEPIGYAWLKREYGIESVQPLPVTSHIGPRREAHTVNGIKTQVFEKRMAPESTLSDHLSFGLRYEGVPLEFLARLFKKIPPTELAIWVNDEPSGRYARRAGFLYEWLTGNELDFKGVKVGNYVDIIDPEGYITATIPVKVARWRIDNNFPGTPDFSPQIRRTDRIKALESENLPELIEKLTHRFGYDILTKSAVWLTTKESRSSFKIEHEGDRNDPIMRFASAIEMLTGTVNNPLSDDFLVKLQQDILINPAVAAGIRRSPIFVGSDSLALGSIVEYAAPPHEAVPKMIEGLRQFQEATRGVAPAIRAAALSFAFVYIHPLIDGNGRVSRFLINDSLRRDEAVPAPVILPISARILHSSSSRMAYDAALELFSKPLMRHFGASYDFGDEVTYSDGVIANFQFRAYDEAMPSWRYIDLTQQTEYMGELIVKSAREDLATEAGYFVDHYETRERIKKIIDAGDMTIDRIIRSIQQNGGKVSQKLMEEVPLLKQNEIRRKVADAVTGGTRSTAINLENSGSTTGSSEFGSLIRSQP